MCVSGYKFKKYKDLKNVVSIDLIEMYILYMNILYIVKPKRYCPESTIQYLKKMQLSVKEKNNDESINYCAGI